MKPSPLLPTIANPLAEMGVSLRRFLSSLGRLLLFVAIAFSPAVATAQTSWQFSPYEVQVWVAAAPRAELGSNWVSTLSEILPGQAQATFAATWNLTVLAAPEKVRHELATREVPPSVDRLEATSDLKGVDKLYVIAIDYGEGEYRLKLRELDVRTRVWSPVEERTTAQPETLPLLAWDGIRAAFTPLARIEKVDGKTVGARVRAGGLIADADSPIQILPGMALKPVIRRNDRTGQPLKGGLAVMPWAVLDVTANEESLLTCTLFSGLRYAIPTRGGPRTERLALLMQPRNSETRLRLQTRGPTPRPLAGYEIFTKLPTGEEDAKLLGATDGGGAFTLQRSDPPLQILYVRNGGQLLARLPLVAGAEAELTAIVADDDQRMHAEGIVLSLQSRVMDLAARREIMAARIRARIQGGRFGEAVQLIEELRQMETRGDLIKFLDGQRQQVRSPETLTQKRIDKLFSDARGLLTKFLDPNLPDVLTAEMERAKAGAAPAPVAAQPMPMPAPTPMSTPTT